MKEQCDFPAFTAYRLEENMLHVEMKKVKELTSRDVEQIYECHHKIGNGNKVYVLVTFQGYIPMSDEAMTQAKKNSSVDQITAATAYVVKNIALRISVKFFMNFYKPKHPMTIWGTKQEAIAWLKLEKKKNAEKQMVLA